MQNVECKMQNEGELGAACGFKLIFSHILV